MMDLLRTHRLVRFAVLYAAILSVALVVLGRLLHTRGQQIREHHGLIVQREKITQDFETLLQDLRETEAEQGVVLSIRPHPEELVPFIRGLESAAARAFIEQSITAVPGVVPAGAGAYSSPVVRYRATLKGTWAKFEAYLHELAQLRHLVRLENVDLRTGPDGDLVKEGNIDVLFTVAVLDPSAPRRLPSALLPPSPAPAVSPSPTP